MDLGLPHPIVLDKSAAAVPSLLWLLAALHDGLVGTSGSVPHPFARLSFSPFLADQLGPADHLRDTVILWVAAESEEGLMCEVQPQAPLWEAGEQRLSLWLS